MKLVVEFQFRDSDLWHSWVVYGVPRDMLHAMWIASTIRDRFDFTSRIRDLETGNVLPVDLVSDPQEPKDVEHKKCGCIIEYKDYEVYVMFRCVEHQLQRNR
jgi:hypothetical protein